MAVATRAAAIEELLRAVGRARGPRKKLQVLGRSWQLLRSLTPDERESVALRFGTDWLWRRVERALLAADMGEAEEVLREALGRMENADPQELRKLAGMVRARDRSGLRDMLLDTLSDALEEAAEEDTPAEGTAAEEAEESARSAEALFPGEPPLEVDDPGDVANERILEEVMTPPDAPRSAPAAPPPSRPQRATAAAPASLALCTPARVPDDVLPPLRSAPMPPRALPETPPPITEARGGPRLESGGAKRAPDKLRTLRELHRNPDRARRMGAAERSQLLAGLGGGWAARRALSAMIRAGAPARLDDALALVATLDTPTRQAWCLADLLEVRDLDADERKRVLEAAPSEPARRRLARRSLRKRR